MPDDREYVFRLKYKSKRDFSNIFEVIELDEPVHQRRYDIKFVDSDGVTDISEAVNDFFKAPVRAPAATTPDELAQLAIVHRIQNTVPEGAAYQMGRLCDSPAVGYSSQSKWAVYISTEWQNPILGEYYMFRLQTTTLNEEPPADLPGSDTPIQKTGANYMHRKKARTTRIY